MTQEFFNVQKDQSEVKTTIVEKYFDAWSRIMLAKARSDRLAYIDLYAGPGVYGDGSESTPVRILQRAIDDSNLGKKLVTIFNDQDAGHAQSLRNVIDAMPGIEKLNHKPQVDNVEVGPEIASLFQGMSLVPTLLFADPWGYKGLTKALIDSVVKDWGCDSIFFFNYTRINMGVRNPVVEQHMNALFGEERAEKLRSAVDGCNPAEREELVVEAISDALDPAGDRFVLPFRFKRMGADTTSHHLIYVSKHPLGYKIMKEVMAKESSSENQGVASYEYNPGVLGQGRLFELSRPLDQLGGMLLNEFAGRRMTTQEIIDTHHIGRPYLAKNYKQVLMQLETEGKITVETAAGKARRKNSFADHLIVNFPAGM